MKVRVADSTGCPVPQFVIEAESEADSLLLKAFLCFPDESKTPWVFRKHGQVSTDGRYTSFNFGWDKAPIKVQLSSGVSMDDVSASNFWKMRCKVAEEKGETLVAMGVGVANDRDHLHKRLGEANAEAAELRMALRRIIDLVPREWQPSSIIRIAQDALYAPKGVNKDG